MRVCARSPVSRSFSRLQVTPTPAQIGGLYAISADTSGKHVYAVGGTAVPYNTSYLNYALNTTMSAGSILVRQAVAAFPQVPRLQSRRRCGG